MPQGNGGQIWAKISFLEEMSAAHLLKSLPTRKVKEARYDMVN